MEHTLREKIAQAVFQWECDCTLTMPLAHYDGAEFGRCEFCERADHEEAVQLALNWDAQRWRLARRIFFQPSYEFSDVESNIGVAYLDGRIVGCGPNLQAAVDSALYLIAIHGEDLPPDAILNFWREHYRSRWNGVAWTRPPPPEFQIDDAFVIGLRSSADYANLSPTPTQGHDSSSEDEGEA